MGEEIATFDDLRKLSKESIMAEERKTDKLFSL